MKKRKTSLILIIIILLMSSGIYSLGDTNIINNMDFQGETVELSLEESLERALTESDAGKNTEWNKQKAKAAYKDNYESAREIRAINNTLKDAVILTKMAEFAREQKDKNYQAELNNLKTQVKQQYFGVIQAQDLVKINEENLNVVEKLYKDILTKFKLGMVARQDVLTTEYNLLDAQTKYEAAKNTYTKAKMGFNIFMGYDVMQDVILTDTLQDIEIPEIEIADAVSEALLNRNEIHGAQYNKELQELSFAQVASRYAEFLAIYIDQKVAYEKALNDYQNAFKAMEMDVRSKYLTMTEKKHAVEAGRKAVESAEEALRLVKLTYDAGMSVLTDVQEMQTRVLQSKLGLSKAILDYNLAVDDFEDSMGVGRVTIPIM